MRIKTRARRKPAGTRSTAANLRLCCQGIFYAFLPLFLCRCGVMPQQIGAVLHGNPPHFIFITATDNTGRLFL